jgi:ABC-type nitrate/sulfonate/bicarbonate transport system ATPase subunit
VTKTRREPSQTPALLVSGLGHSYAGAPVLDGVELIVGASGRGELVALLGTSGSGKSTLLALGRGLRHALPRPQSPSAASRS